MNATGQACLLLQHKHGCGGCEKDQSSVAEVTQSLVDTIAGLVLNQVSDLTLPEVVLSASNARVNTLN